MNKIDLQMHSIHSDGRNSPQELVQLAHENGVGTIALTDHDIISGVEDALAAGKKYNINVIPAVEITTGFKGFSLHVLGYNIDIKNKSLIQFLDKIAAYRKKHFTGQIDRLNENLKLAGKKTANAEHYSNKEPKYYSIPGLALFMFEEKIFSTKNEGFLHLQGIADAAPKLEPKDAINIIHQAGGKAFISHPFAPLLSLKNITAIQDEQEKIISLFKEQNLDGLECYQAGHDQDDVIFCKMLAKKYNLSISAGSDWHGSLQEAGKTIKKYLPFYLEKFGDLCVPESEIENILNGLR